MLSHSMTHGHRPALFADIDRNTQFGGVLTPLHLIAAPRLDRLPGDLQRPLIHQFYQRRKAARDWPARTGAQDWIAGEVATLERERLGVAFDDWEIRQRADRAARLCQKMMVLEVMQDHARTLGIDPPEVTEKRSRLACVKRLQCPRWWCRKMRRHYTRRAESHLRALGLVQKRNQIYASDRAVSWRQERKTGDAALLKEMQAVSDCGDQLNLFEVAEKSLANPALRRAELMVRARGFEEVALAAGHRARFFTNTCPSAYHRTLSNGAQNPRWQGFTPREGQQWLCRAWARTRAKLQRMCISFYGFRVAEPHHDGTPHWHLLLFGSRRALKEVARVMRLVWFAEFADELDNAKARTARFHVKAITRSLRADGTYTSATGYIAKYIAKNIDGFQVGEDFETQKGKDGKGRDAADTCNRVAAWASAHGIRQFQQVGGPGVGVWRELRRLRSVCDASPAIEAARAASDQNDWAGFIAAVGGIGAGRRSAVGLWKVWSDKETQYGEARGQVVAGVASATVRVCTREKTWRIERKARAPLPDGTHNAASVASCSRAPSFLPAHPQMPAMLAYERERIAGGAALAPFRSYLGPVSITVRGFKSVPDAREQVPVGKMVNQRARGSPWVN